MHKRTWITLPKINKLYLNKGESLNVAWTGGWYTRKFDTQKLTHYTCTFCHTVRALCHLKHLYPCNHCAQIATIKLQLQTLIIIRNSIFYCSSRYTERITTASTCIHWVHIAGSMLYMDQTMTIMIYVVVTVAICLQKCFSAIYNDTHHITTKP